MYQFLSKGRVVQTCDSFESAVKAAINHGLNGYFGLEITFPDEKGKPKKWTLAKFIEKHCLF